MLNDVDRRKFDDLWRSCERSLRYQAFRRLANGHDCDDIIDDVLQQTALVMCKPGFRRAFPGILDGPPLRFRNAAVFVMRRFVLPGMLSKLQKSRRVATSTFCDTSEDSRAVRPDDDASRREIAGIVRQIVDDVPNAHHAEVLRMRHFRGLTMPEIGDELGISRQRVHQIVASAEKFVLASIMNIPSIARR